MACMVVVFREVNSEHGMSQGQASKEQQRRGLVFHLLCCLDLHTARFKRRRARAEALRVTMTWQVSAPVQDAAQQHGQSQTWMEMKPKPMAAEGRTKSERGKAPAICRSHMTWSQLRSQFCTELFVMSQTLLSSSHCFESFMGLSDSVSPVHARRLACFKFSAPLTNGRG